MAACMKWKKMLQNKLFQAPIGYFVVQSILDIVCSLTKVDSVKNTKLSMIFTIGAF